MYLFTVANAFAEESLQTIDVVADEEAPITGDVVHEEFTGSHVRIGRESLERHDASLGEILAFETGVQLRQIGGIGNFSAVTIRGGSQQHTGVFLDGIALNSGGNSVIDLSTLDMLNIESADIYRGSSPVQFAFGALSGAVNLKTLGAQADTPHTTAALSGGSFGTRQVQFSHQSVYGDWDVVGSASHLSSDNNYRFVNENGTPLNLLDDQVQLKHNAQVQKSGVLSKLGYRWNDRDRTDFLFQTNNRELGVPEWRNSEINDAQLATEDTQINLSHAITGLGDWNHKIGVFQHHQTSHFIDELSQIGLGPQNTLQATSTKGVQAAMEHIGERGTFALTASVRKEALESNDAIANSSNYNVKRASTRANAQYALFLGDNFLVTPAVRWQSISDRYNGTSLRNTNERASSVFTPQLGLKMEHSDRLQLRANVGLVHREPAFYELFGSQGLINGNNNLDAERGINSDIGVSVKWSEKHSTNATLFINHREELISIVFDSRGVGRSINAGESSIRGIELENQFQLTKKLSTKFNLTVQETKNISDFLAFRNKQLPGQSNTTAFAKIQYNTQRYRLWLELESKSDHFYDQANLLPAKGYLTQNAGIDYRWKQFEAKAVVNNIGNEIIQDYNGYARPGRAYFFSLTFRL